jgi:myosin heavy subunit
LFDDLDTFREKQKNQYKELIESQKIKAAPHHLQKFRNKVLEEAKSDVQTQSKTNVPKFSSQDENKPKKILNLKPPVRKNAIAKQTDEPQQGKDLSDEDVTPKLEQLFEEERQQLNAEILALKKQVQNGGSNQELEDLREQLDKQQMEFDIERLKLHTQITQAQEALESRNSTTNVDTHVKELIEQRDHARKQFEDMDIERLKSLTTVKELTNIRDELKKKNEDQEKTIRTLGNQLDILQLKMTNFDSEKQSLTDQLKKANEEHDKIKQERDAAIKEKDLQSTKGSELSQLQAKLEKQNKELVDAKKTIEKLKRDVHSLSSRSSSNAGSTGASLIGCKWERSSAPKSYRMTDDDTTINALHDYVDGAAVSTLSLSTSGVYKWEYTLENGGGATYVGVVTNLHQKNKSLRTCPHAWALRIEGGGVLFENGKQTSTNYWGDDHKVESGAKVTVVADMSLGTVNFLLNGQDGGIAFQNVSTCVYPAITVYHRGVVSTDFNPM